MEGLEGIWISVGLSGMWLVLGLVLWLTVRDRRRRREERRRKVEKLLAEALESGADPEDVAILERRLREMK